MHKYSFYSRKGSLRREITNRKISLIGQLSQFNRVAL